MSHNGTPYTNREGCDFEWPGYDHPDDNNVCLRDAEYAIFATFEAEGGEVSVHAPMYVCRDHFHEQLPKYTQKWHLAKRLLTLTVVPVTQP